MRKLANGLNCAVKSSSPQTIMMSGNKRSLYSIILGGGLKNKSMMNQHSFGKIGFNVMMMNNYSTSSSSTSTTPLFSPRYNVVVLDIEGTSTNTSYCRMIEVACARIVDGTSISSFTSLVNADIDYIPEPVQEITKITKAMIDLSPPPQIVLSQLYNFLSSQPSLVVGHNVRFDASVIYNEFVRYKIINNEVHKPDDFISHSLFTNTLCTLKLARRLFQGQPDYKLGNLVENLGLGRSINAHRAHADVSMTTLLWRRIYRESFERLGGEIYPDHEFFLKLQETPAKDVRKFIEMYKMEKTYGN
ncbi:predicted protein [Naegleria gruberi]|uniref:Predicted protein n=1 Tax=Naegleria gruberi TaxID=5762 RepID=D2VB97_NAEGR|nr:uncharacterized protein NAEGRDRAFT_66139 [Naegleria gruberi]EFC45870.1 predicted protein [Naegleria gruberi]|eukprot:XP_002678614.1 predicted protein [Naegleria gruberi strain NEG-M]